MLYLLYEEKAKSRTYGIGDEELSFDDYRMAVSEYYGKTNPIVQKMKETRENFNNLILEQ
ncbi:MAG: hypothetical protein LBF15_01235 [Candidatus Peribacteria bacterium]|jgi:hypothetical protein|nr:hypothetical protein [Candidatus Peribacteria bacterium]